MLVAKRGRFGAPSGIGGLGFGCPPGGDKDEVCAQAGLAKVAELIKN